MSADFNFPDNNPFYIRICFMPYMALLLVLVVLLVLVQLNMIKGKLKTNVK